MPSAPSVVRWLAPVLVAAAILAAPTPARAQFICANFFPTVDGTYGDLMAVDVEGTTTTATAHGVTGLHLGAAATTCTSYVLGQDVARIDLQVVGLDPGEAVTFELDGAPYAFVGEDLIRTPDVTTQAVTIEGGALVSAGADGSAAVEVQELGMDRFAICATGDAGSDGVIVLPIINSFCQCGNGNKHVNEDCDDGAFEAGDGCSPTCAVEPGWTCSGNPSLCTLAPPPDAAVPDAMPPDAMPPDAAVPDAAVPDAAVPDAAVADAAVPDAAAPDAARFDAAVPDASAPEDGGVDGDTPPRPDAASDLTPLDPPEGCGGCGAGGAPAGPALLVALASFVARRRARMPR